MNSTIQRNDDTGDFKVVPNPEYENAPYELGLINNAGDHCPVVPNPHRFRTMDDYKKFIETSDPKYSIPPYIKE